MGTHPQFEPCAQSIQQRGRGDRFGLPENVGQRRKTDLVIESGFQGKRGTH